MKKLLSIVIIHYRTKHYVKSCVDSITAQTYRPIELIFIDNNSADGSVEYIEKYQSALDKNDKNFQFHLIPNTDNLGYAGAANQGIDLAKGEYVVITNPDIIFEPDYFEKAIARMEQDPKIAALTGKMKKFNFPSAGITPEHVPDPDGTALEVADFEKGKTNLIDTVGLFAYPNRRVIDDGQGLEDGPQFDKECETFGVSGACPLYRRSALEDVKIGDEYLDNNFFMYKEDVDISWRFQLFGWKALYYPSARAWHGRGTGVEQRFSTGQVLENRGKLSKFQKHYSYKNQRLMQLKNELPANFLQDFFPMIWKEILSLGYMTVREPFLFKSMWHMFKQIPSTLRKRRHIMKHKRVTAKDMKKWFSRKQSKYVK